MKNRLNNFYFILIVAIITDILDLLNIFGISTIFGYEITKSISFGLNLFVLMLISFSNGLDLIDMRLFVIESLPVTELLPIMTYLVLKANNE